MAEKKKSKPSDRLQVMQKIDSRMNPGRTRAEPTNWEIKGELFLNCSCTVFCPCVVSLGAHPPTEGHCHAWMAIAIDEGHFEGESLAGLNVGLLVDIPGRMGEGNWRVAAYVDENATQKAYNGILKIFSGAAGGTTGLFTMLVSEIIGAERAPVEIIREGNKRSIAIGRKIQGEIEMISGKSDEHPVMVTNSKYWMGPDIIAAVGKKSRVRDYGRVWDFGGKSAEICPIEWSGP